MVHQIKDFVEKINKNFKQLYKPSENLSLDEGMIPYRGKCEYKVYIKGKPKPEGIKEYVVADSLNGYTLHTQ